MRNSDMLTHAIIDIDENCDPAVSPLGPLVAAGIAQAKQLRSLNERLDQIIKALVAIAHETGQAGTLADHRPQFVQVSHHRLRTDHILDVEDFGTGINVWMSDGRVAQLQGADKAAFLLWHEQNADVVRLTEKD